MFPNFIIIKHALHQNQGIHSDLDVAIQRYAVFYDS